MNAIAGFLAGLAGGLGIACGPAAGTIEIDPTKSFQTLSGWEATAQTGSLDLQDRNGFAQYRGALFDAVVDDLGIDRLRLSLMSSVEHTKDLWTAHHSGDLDRETFRSVRYTTVNDNDDPFDLNPEGFVWSEIDYRMENIVLPIKQRLEARGEKLFLNLNYVGFTSDRPFVHDDPDEYAEMVLATVLHLDERFGVVPDAWEVILEPDNKTHFDGRLIGRAIVASAARLEAAGYDVPFIAPATTCTRNTTRYLDDITAVPGAAEKILEVSYHRYCGGPDSDSMLTDIASRAHAIGAQTSMLEHMGSDHVALREDLTLANVSAWQQYTLAFVGTNDTGGKYYLVDETDPARPVVTLSSRGAFLRQYFRYIRRGAVRHGASSTTSAYAPTAFTNANGTAVVVVEAAEAGSMTITNLPPGTYGVSYTTASETGVEAPPREIEAGEPLETAIPAPGVLSVYDVDFLRGDPPDDSGSAQPPGSTTGSPSANGPPSSR